MEWNFILQKRNENRSTWNFKRFIERNKKLLVCGEYLNVLNNVDIADLNESDHIYIKWDDMSDSIKKVFKEFTNPGAYIVTLFELDSKDKNEYLLDILSFLLAIQ